MKRATAKQIAKLCPTASGLGYTVEPISKQEIRSFDFDEKESDGAFRVSDGRTTLLLLFVDWRYGNNFYVVAADLRGSPLVEIHEATPDQRTLTWTYQPSKRDGRNAERRQQFLEHFGALTVHIAVPTNASEILEFLDELFLLVAQRELAHELRESDDAGDVTFPEGRLFERRHWARERSRALTRLAKKRVLDGGGTLDCAVCGFNFARVYGPHGDGYIEAHHTLPVSELEEDAVTRVEDIALVCANCHRMLHVRRPWLGMKDLRSLLRRNRA